MSRQIMDCTKRTLEDYHLRIGQFARFLAERFPDTALADVQRRHIEAYLVWLREGGRKPWTVRTHHRALRALYSWAVAEDLLLESPMRRIPSPRTPKIQKPFLTTAQFQRLLAFCPTSTFVGARTTAMLLILWTSGMRSEEMSNLRIADLEPEKERIKVYGKGRKERYVEYPMEARRAVWQYMKFRRDDLPELWLTEERDPLKLAGARIAISRTYQRAGFKVKDELHILRRTWAVNKIRQGVNIKYIMVLGGWEDISTMDKYVAAVETEEALDAVRRKPLRR